MMNNTGIFRKIFFAEKFTRGAKSIKKCVPAGIFRVPERLCQNGRTARTFLLAPQSERELAAHAGKFAAETAHERLHFAAFEHFHHLAHL